MLEYFHSDPVGCYCIILAVIVSYILFLHLKKYVIKRNYLIRTNYTIIIACITIILGYVVSLNSSLLSAYDKPPQNYNFLNPYDAIRFPFEQVKIIHNVIEPVKLGEEEFNKNDIPYYFILVDKTKSTELPRGMKNTVQALRQDLIKYISSSENTLQPQNEPQNIDYETRIKNLDLRDLVVLYFLRTLYNNASSSNQYSFQIRLYSGNNNFHVIASERLNTGQIKVAEAFNRYLDTVSSLNIPSGQTTNFKEMLNNLYQARYTNNNFGSSNIILISDFMHEPTKSGISFKAMESFINRENKVTNNFRLSLYKLLNNKSENDSIEKTVEIINKNFLNAITYYFDESSVVSNQKNYEEYLNSLFSTTYESNIFIPFFFPGNDATKRVSCAVSKCHLPHIKQNYTFNFNNQNLSALQNSSFLKIDGSEILLCNSPKVLDTPTNKTGIFSIGLFINKNIPQDNYLEISSPGSIKSISYRINILEKLPGSSAIIMCVCYLMILILYLCNSIFYCTCSIKSFFYGGNYYYFTTKEECNKFENHVVNNIKWLEVTLLAFLQFFIIYWIVKTFYIVSEIFINIYPWIYFAVISLLAINIACHLFWNSRKLHFAEHDKNN